MNQRRSRPDDAIIKRTLINAVRLERDRVGNFDKYPFSVPAVRHLHRLEFHPAVTFFVGENGSGKSTLLEAIAIKLGFNAEGGHDGLQFQTRDSHSGLYEKLRLERGVGKSSDYFFLRAESFYNVASELERLEEEFPSKRGVPFEAYGGKSLHAQSHGEAFISLLVNRLKGNGIYLFDEPEAALSPQRQLGVLTLFERLVRRRSQFIIATHSPILLAYPNARIYHFAADGIHEIKYTETEHYRITKDFLNRHERMLELLLTDDNLELPFEESES